MGSGLEEEGFDVADCSRVQDAPAALRSVAPTSS
jgi:hypothetical protein